MLSSIFNRMFIFVDMDGIIGRDNNKPLIAIMQTRDIYMVQKITFHAMQAQICALF